MTVQVRQSAVGTEYRSGFKTLYVRAGLQQSNVA